MAKKVSYRAVPIERLTSALLAAMLVGVSKLVVAIDVAKLKMMAGFGSEDGSIARLVSATHARAPRVRDRCDHRPRRG